MTPKQEYSAFIIGYAIMIVMIVVVLCQQAWEIELLRQWNGHQDVQLSLLRAKVETLELQLDGHAESLRDWYKWRADRAAGWLSADYWANKAMEADQ